MRIVVSFFFSLHRPTMKNRWSVIYRNSSREADGNSLAQQKGWTIVHGTDTMQIYVLLKKPQGENQMALIRISFSHPRTPAQRHQNSTKTLTSFVFRHGTLDAFTMETTKVICGFMGKSLIFIFRFSPTSWFRVFDAVVVVAFTAACCLPPFAV